MLYLVRHGTTNQGFFRTPGDLRPATYDEWIQDHELSDRGVREAESLRRRLALMQPLDRVLASPRKRTTETARIALPSREAEVDSRLHEWHVDERIPELLQRARWVLQQGEENIVAVFSHGGLIRAVIAALAVGGDDERFGATFDDLRRVLHIWNGSLTIVGHGASGLELLAVNLCDDIDAMAGRKV
jgi:broad specificity phosphatase PhoE